MQKSQSHKIFLLAPDTENKKNIADLCRREKIDYWIYFGKNVTQALIIERSVGSLAKKIETGIELQKTAVTFRQDYIDYLGRCSAEAKDPLWYLTSISEKNIYASDFYLAFCYIKTLVAVTNEVRGNFCVFCESRALRDSIITNHPEVSGYEVIPDVRGPELFSGRFTASWVSSKNLACFISRYVMRIFSARVFRAFCGKILPFPDSKPVVALHSWADARSFLSPGRYTDIYFGDLGKKIERQGLDCVYIVNVLPTLFYPSAFMKLRSSGIPWILFEEFLHVADVFTAVRLKRAVLKNIPKNTRLSGLDISDLIKEEWARDLRDTRPEQSYLWYKASSALAGQADIHSVFYTFENHIWEKMFILGFRSSRRPVRMIGYAHVTVNPMELLYTISGSEKNIIPLPDFIAVNGARSKEVLVESGFPADRISIVGSLRYENVRQAIDAGAHHEHKNILLVLSADINRSIEMIAKSTMAFGGLEGVAVLVKPHPTMKISSLDHYIRQMPQNFSATDQPISRSLPDIDLMVYSDSTAAVEAAINGIPLVHLKSDYSIDVDPFEGLGLVPSESSPEYLRNAVLGILHGKGGPLENLTRTAEEFFEPVSMERFGQLFSKGQ